MPASTSAAAVVPLKSVQAGCRRKVGFCYTIKNLSQVDSAEGSFRAIVRVVFTWVDTAYVGKTEVLKDKLDWYPKFSIRNGEYSKKDPKFQVICQGTGRIGMAVSFEGTFLELFEAGAFPLDTQGLNIKLKLKNEMDICPTTSRVPRIDSIVKLPDWCIISHDKHSPAMVHVGTSYATDSNTLKTYRLILITIKVSRQSQYFIWNGVLPNSAIVSLGAAAYFYRPVPNAMDFLVPRIEITVGLLLTQMAFRFNFSGLLPPVSYLTAWDKYMLISTAFLMFMVLEACWISHQLNEKLASIETVTDRDNNMFIVWSVLWAFNHVCWFAYWYVRTKRPHIHEAERHIYGENWQEIRYKGLQFEAEAAHFD